MDGVQDRFGAEVPEGGLGDGDPVGGGQAGAADGGLGRRLVEGLAAGFRGGAHIRDAQQGEDALDRAVLAGGAVQGGEDGVGAVGEECRQERRVDVADLYLDAHPAQRVGDAAAGADRDVALVAEAAGQDDDTAQVAHCNHCPSHRLVRPRSCQHVEVDRRWCFP